MRINAQIQLRAKAHWSFRVIPDLKVGDILVVPNELPTNAQAENFRVRGNIFILKHPFNQKQSE